jgi:glyoxylase-like metal-dependent hydrolase (beta-lactamase superfamily II)
LTGPELADLGDGVFRITHPLPWALDHVHCYALASEDGWTIVDCGLGTESTLEHWRDVLHGLQGYVQRIVITHYHPDHLGAAAALSELTGPAEIVQGRLDARLADRAWGPEADGSAFEAYLRLHGMPSAVAAASASAEVRLPVRPVEATRLVGEGDELEAAGETFEVLHLPGHADGHIALAGRDSGRMFAGDVLLSEITPNVGRWEDTAYDPLGRYLATLERVEQLAPPLVYPGHGPVISHPAGRAVEIRAHHDERLEVARRALLGGAETTYDVMEAIWPDELSLHEQRFALVEAVSHLERLCVLGKARETAPGRWTAT